MRSQPSSKRSTKKNGIRKKKLLPYAAKLLFQFRVGKYKPGTVTVCETSIIRIDAENPKVALRMAKKYGKEQQHNYYNDEHVMVHFEFLGVRELLFLGPYCGNNEVWYDVDEILDPQGNIDQLILPEEELEAIRNEKERIGLYY